MSLRALICTLIALTTACPALALSCMPYGVTDAYRDAAAAEGDYVVVHGRLTFDESRLPQVDWANQAATPDHTRIPAQIDGASLTRAGFTATFRSPIEIDVQCFGPWCAGAESGIDYLAFLKRENGRYLLEITPCGGFSFGGPDPEQLDQVLACLQGKSCKPTRRR